MFADKTLTPKETLRLCALGTLAEADGAIRYSELAGRVRLFVGRVAGPSLDLMWTSIELLLYEDLIEAIDGQGMEDDARLALTNEGRREFHRLMTAHMRASSDLSKLVAALKFRFMPLLDHTERCLQADMLVDTAETELNRLTDLRDSLTGDNDALTAWLDHEIAQSEARLHWLDSFRNGLDAGIRPQDA